MPFDCPNRAELRRQQLIRLNSLLVELRRGNAFYGDRLRRAGLDRDASRLADFIEACPFTEKLEFSADQERHPPFGTNLTYPLERYSRFHQTSGSSGRPLRWLDTNEDWAAMLEDWVRVFRAAGVTSGDRICFAFSFGPFLGFWMAFDAAQRVGCLCLPAGGMSSAARLNLMRENHATVLCCTPTYAMRLAEAAREEGISPGELDVRLIVVAGEPGGSVPATRARIENAWNGARLFDHHGMTEVGPVTYECPKQPGVLHIMETSFLAEVLDPNTGNPAAAGGEGELILTTLRRVGSPVLRYRTGDRVRAGFAPESESVEACACGSHELPLLGGILGRVDEMVIVRGVNVYPSSIEAILREAGGVAEYRVVVGSRGPMKELRIEVEPEAASAAEPELAARLEQAIERSLNLRVPVTVVGPESLPRFELKSKRWTRENE